MAAKIPTVQFTEQPARYSGGFFYENQIIRSPPSIQGVKSTKEQISYPKIKISNFTGEAYLYICCVTHNKPYLQHPHQLESNNEIDKGGIFRLKVQMKESIEFEINDISIRKVRRCDFAASLSDRKKHNIDPTSGGWHHLNNTLDLELDTVRLCVVLMAPCGNNKWRKCFIVSDALINQSPVPELRITEISSKKSSVLGGERIIMLCDKINRDDIAIRIFETDARDRTIWLKEIRPSDSTHPRAMKVHYEHAIAFTTPSYKTGCEFAESERIFIQLFRPSDGIASEPIPFEYVPHEDSTLRRKRFRKDNEPPNPSITSLVQQNNKVPKQNQQMPVMIFDFTNLENNSLNPIDKEMDPKCVEEATPSVDKTSANTTSVEKKAARTNGTEIQWLKDAPIIIEEHYPSDQAEIAAAGRRELSTKIELPSPIDATMFKEEDFSLNDPSSVNTTISPLPPSPPSDTSSEQSEIYSFPPPKTAAGLLDDPYQYPNYQSYQSGLPPFYYPYQPKDFPYNQPAYSGLNFTSMYGMPFGNYGNASYPFNINDKDAELSLLSAMNNIHPIEKQMTNEKNEPFINSIPNLPDIGRSTYNKETDLNPELTETLKAINDAFGVKLPDTLDYTADVTSFLSTLDNLDTIEIL